MVTKKQVIFLVFLVSGFLITILMGATTIVKDVGDMYTNIYNGYVEAMKDC